MIFLKHTLYSTIAIVISLLTATGVFMHDMRIDKAIGVALFSTGAAVAHASTQSITAKIADFTHGDAHTHPDFKPVKSLMNGFTYQAPSIPPRERTHMNRYVAQKKEPLRHAFDDVFMPLIS